MAGLDSIAQAAGRCNRGGELGAGEKGEARIFIPPDPPPPFLRMGASIARRLLRKGIDLTAPESFANYFRGYYGCVGSLDAKQIDTMLRPNCLQFRSAAKAFRLIDDDWQKSIVVRYPPSLAGAEANKALLARLQTEGLSRSLSRRLQRYVVNISEKQCTDAAARGEVEECGEVWVSTADSYDERIGLNLRGDFRIEKRGERLVKSANAFLFARCGRFRLFHSTGDESRAGFLRRHHAVGGARHFRGDLLEARNALDGDSNRCLKAD